MEARREGANSESWSREAGAAGGWVGVGRLNKLANPNVDSNDWAGGEAVLRILDACDWRRD